MRSSRMGDPLRHLPAIMILIAFIGAPAASQAAEEHLYGRTAVIVCVEVEETFAYLPVAGLSISDENGISAGGGFKSVNLLGRAMYFSGQARFGGETTVETVLRDPWVTGDHVGYTAEYYYREKDNVILGFFETASEAGLLVRRHAGEHGRLGARVFFHGIESDIDGRTLTADNLDMVLYGGLIAEWDSRNISSNPHRGWWSSVDVERSGLLGTDSDFWRANFDIRRYQPIGEGHTLAIFSLYTATTGKVGAEIAPWQTFGIGGSNTIRGYEVGSSLGKPVDKHRRIPLDLHESQVV